MSAASPDPPPRDRHPAPGTAEAFRALVEATAQAVWTADAGGRIVDSPSWRAFTGQAAEELARAGWTAAVHPGDRPRVADGWRRAVEAGDPYDDEFRVRHAEGATWRWTRCRAVPLPGPSDAPVGWAGMNEDVTERREAEAALRQSERVLREVAEAVPDVLYRSAPDGRIDFLGGQFERLTGRAPDDFLGSLMWPELVHPDDRGRVETVWGDAVECGESYETRYRLLTPDGTRWVITRAHPVRDDDGAVTAWFGSVTDVDSLVRAEREVRRLNETLEDRVAERTRQVRRLMARLAAAEQAERARVAHVLHDDLQQQLVGLGITLGLLRSSATEAERADLRAQADEVLEDAVALTRSLVTEIAPPVLASADLGETLRWLARWAGALHRLAVAVEVEAPCPVPDADARALVYHVVRELLLNVVKHAGAKRATVRAWRSGADVVVEVEDGGRGFVPGGAPDAFGLVSVRERVELADGRLDLDTAPGDGTRVRVTVPVQPEPSGTSPGGPEPAA